MKPKQKVHKVINKSFLLWGINLKENINVYYAWNKNKKINYPFILVDYDKTKREWYIMYVIDKTIIYSCTIDDITCNGAITTFK